MWCRNAFAQMAINQSEWRMGRFSRIVIGQWGILGEPKRKGNGVVIFQSRMYRGRKWEKISKFFRDLGVGTCKGLWVDGGCGVRDMVECDTSKER